MKTIEEEEKERFQRMVKNLPVINYKEKKFISSIFDSIKKIFTKKKSYCFKGVVKDNNHPNNGNGDICFMPDFDPDAMIDGEEIKFRGEPDIEIKGEKIVPYINYHKKKNE